MKKFHVIGWTFALGFALTACSGGGRSALPGAQCTAKFKPVKLENLPPEKVKGINDTLPAGDYTLVRGGLFYKADNGFKILVNYGKPTDSKVFKASGGCARDTARAPKDGKFLFPSINHMTITASGKVTADVGKFGFVVENTRILAKVGDLDSGEEKTVEAPGKVYEETSSIIYVVNEEKGLYEIRSETQIDGAVLSRFARFRRKDLVEENSLATDSLVPRDESR